MCLGLRIVWASPSRCAFYGLGVKFLGRFLNLGEVFGRRGAEVKILWFRVQGLPKALRVQVPNNHTFSQNLY